MKTRVLNWGRAVAAVSLLWSGACSETKAPKADAAVVADAPTADASLKDCFTNYDCPMNETCLQNAQTEVVQCVIGARGTGLAGAGCQGERDCKSALCTDGPAGTGRLCSDVCAGPQDCPENLPQCLNVFGTMMCVRKSP